jgi:flagella basal body P-ring formation protein FlgA
MIPIVMLALAAGALENLDVLDLKIGMAARAVGRVAVPLDRGIRVPRCPTAPQIDVTYASSLAVRCPALGWHLHVGVVTFENTLPSPKM